MDHYSWFALKSVPHIGNVAFCRLLARFGSPECVLNASSRELLEVAGISPNAVESILSHNGREEAERECAEVRRHGIRIVTFLDREYPKPLLEIRDYPPFLYVRGELRGDEMSVAVVGSRRASTYGLSATERISRDLAVAGIAVVSGMARGIDTAAHRGALKGGGRTIGVLGCGIDVVYPPENRPLYRQLEAEGAIVSEFPMGTAPLAENFPRRNRIISGLSRGVVVVEAAAGSGSLITVQYALEQGREVFAVPGNINSGASRGTNALIKEGAKLVDSIEDILAEIRGFVPAQGGKAEPPASFSLTPEEALIFTLVAESPLHIDDIIVQSALTVGEVSATLLRLELKGAVRQLPGKHFALAGY
jgi:DNA processing protein